MNNAGIPNEKQAEIMQANLTTDHPLDWQAAKDKRNRELMEKSSNFPPLQTVEDWFKTTPPNREYIIENFLPKMNVGLIAGPGGAGKSYLTMQLGMVVASGLLPFFKENFIPGRAGGVLYINAEDDAGEQHRRFIACFDELKNQLFANADAGTFQRKLTENFHWLPVTGKTRIELYPDENRQCQNQIIWRAKQIPNLKLIIMDPASRLSNGDFNKSDETTRFIQSLEEIAEQTGATILLVTHTNKKSGEDGDMGVGSVLGSQAFTNACRWVMTMRTMTEKEADRFRIPKAESEKFTRFKIPKANYLPAGSVGTVTLKRTESGTLELFESESHMDYLPVLEWLRDNPGETTQTKFKNQIKKTLSVAEHKAREIITHLETEGFIQSKQGEKHNAKVYELDIQVIQMSGRYPEIA